MCLISCKKPVIIKNKFISTSIGTFGIIFALGFIYPISNFSVYMTSYIHEKQDFVTMHYGLFINLIFTFSMTLGTSIGGILELRLGLFFTTLVGFIIILITNIFFLNIQNIWLCYILTLISGIGVGIASSLGGKNLTLYKPDKKGLIVSIIGGVTILLAGIFSIVGEKIINPDGYTLGEEEEYYEYKYSSRTYLYFTLGFFSLPLGAIIFLLFTFEYSSSENYEQIESTNSIEKEENVETEEKSESITNGENLNNEGIIIEEKNNKEEKSNETDENNKEGDILEKDIKKMNKKKNIKKVIKTFRFWKLALIKLLIAFSFSFIVNTGRTFGALIGIDGNALQYLMICQTASLIIIGPILGIFVDRKGPLNLLRITSLVCMIPGILLTFLLNNSVIFIISFMIAVMCLISNMVGFSPFIMEIYGIEESVILEGISNVFSKLSEVITTVAAFVISLIYSKNEIVKPYRIMYIIGFIFSFFSLLLLIFENKEKFDYDKKDEDLGNLIEKDRFSEVNV